MARAGWVRALVVFALVASVFVAGRAGAATPTPVRPPLAWAPPVLTDPIVLQVTNANRRLWLDDTRDYRLRIVEPLQQELWVDGGRNVVVVGGRVSIDAEGSNPSSYQENTALKIRNGDPTGIVHVEGLLIDGAYVSDGIALSTQRTVQLENVRVERVRDGIKGGHADCIQPQAGVGTLRVDRFTCTTERQGIFLNDAPGRIGPVDLRNVDLHGAPGKHLFFQAQASAGPVRLASVWLDTPTPWAPFGYWVYPTVAGAEGDAARRAVRGKQKKTNWPLLRFVGTNITGAALKGTPRSGEFVPAAVVGTAYRSPGYR
jgi:hypothetical protein